MAWDRTFSLCCFRLKSQNQQLSSILLTTNHLPTHCAENRLTWIFHLLETHLCPSVSRHESLLEGASWSLALSHHIILYHIVSYFISYHIISYHFFHLYHFISFHYISFHCQCMKQMCMFLQVACVWGFDSSSFFVLCFDVIIFASLNVCNERTRHRSCAALKAGEATKKMIHIMVTRRWSQKFQIHYPYFTFCFLALILECDTCQNISKRISLWRSCIT